MQEQLTPEQAINILDQATAQISASRQDHAVIQQAIQVLRESIAPKEEKASGKA